MKKNYSSNIKLILIKFSSVLSLFSKHAELSDEQILDLAKKMTDRAQLQNLAINLGMSHDERTIDERYVTEAAYLMLSSWMELQPDRNRAHKNLVQALKNADILGKIHLILPKKTMFSRLRKMMSGTIVHFKAHIKLCRSANSKKLI